jgi:hypothetical protein
MPSAEKVVAALGARMMAGVPVQMPRFGMSMEEGTVVPVEDVGTHVLAHARRGEVVPDVREAQPRRNPPRAAAGREEDGLPDAPSRR